MKTTVKYIVLVVAAAMQVAAGEQQQLPVDVDVQQAIQIGQQQGQPEFFPNIQVNGEIQAPGQQRAMRNAAPLKQQDQGDGPSRQDGVLRESDIRRARERAIAHLQSCLAEDGSIQEGIIHYSEGAATVMGALAMLAAGADPESDPSLRRALEWLRKNDQENTYFRAVRANVWEYALRRSPEDAQFRTALQRDSDWLVNALKDKEGWRYMMTSTDWDNSVTQYGVLGIWAACRAGIEPPEGFWLRMSRHFRKCQNSDGGWGYQQGGSSANMATAGLATMFLVFDMYHGRTSYSASNGNPFASGEASECLASISRGMEWLDTHGGDNDDGYYLYGIERTGVASGRKYIGGHDWFRDGMLSILRHQKADGAIPLNGYGQTRINTAFASLFMVYGGAPVAFNKLQYGDGQDWNLNPRDVANVTKHLWGAYESPLNWFSVAIDAPAEDFEAPVLFISGAAAPAFTDKQVDTLRAYVARGGLILAEPSDGSEAFRVAMESLVGKLYPPGQFPTHGLRALDPEHPIYTVIPHPWTERPALRAASDGSRVFFVLSDGYMSRDWQMNHTHQDSFQLAMNLLFYATDQGELHPRFHSVMPDTLPSPSLDRAIKVGRLVHGPADAPACDWRIGEAAVNSFAPFLRHVHGIGLNDAGPVDLLATNAPAVQVLTLTGTCGLTLDERATAALKQFLAGGGTLVVDAYAGSPQFARDARAYITRELGELVPLPADHDIVTGRFAGGFDLVSAVGYTLPARKTLRAEGASTSTHHLEALMLDGRAAVVFSPYDLTSAVSGASTYRSAGYRPATARRVMANIYGYVAQFL